MSGQPISITRRERTLLRAATGINGISRADLYRRVKDRWTAGDLTDAMRSLADRGLIITKEGDRPKHGVAALHYYATTTSTAVEGGREPPRPFAKPDPLPRTPWQGLALQVVEARLHGANWRYRDTQPGRVDLESLKAAATLKAWWAEHPAEPISVAALGRAMIEQHQDGEHATVVDTDTARRLRLPLAVEALRKAKLVILAMKSTVIAPGPEWAENDA